MIPVVDGYMDLICFFKKCYPKSPFEKISKEYSGLEQLVSGHVRIIISAFNCPDSQNGPRTSTNFLSDLLDYSQNYLGFFPILSSSKHLTQIMGSAGLPAVIQLLNNADALIEWDLLDLWHQGFRAIRLTHKGTNRIADGHGVPNPKGLSTKGKDLMHRISECGFILDLACLSEPSFNQVINIFTGALVVSHTGLRRFCDIPRNLSEEQVRIIMDRGGIIGVTFAPELLSSDKMADLWEVFIHIDWLVQQYGPDQVALSSDFQKNRIHFSTEDYWIQFQRLAELLQYYGYPYKTIVKIMGGNWSEFYALHMDHNHVYESVNQ